MSRSEPPPPSGVHSPGGPRESSGANSTAALLRNSYLWRNEIVPIEQPLRRLAASALIAVWTTATWMVLFGAQVDAGAAATWPAIGTQVTWLLARTSTWWLSTFVLGSALAGVACGVVTLGFAEAGPRLQNYLLYWACTSLVVGLLTVMALAVMIASAEYAVATATLVLSAMLATIAGLTGRMFRSIA